MIIKKHNGLFGGPLQKIFLFILPLLLLVSIAVMPLIDPSEGRYATVSKLMATTGNYITPQIWVDGKIVPFWGKPPLFFWLSSMSMKVFGFTEFAARLPGFVAGILLILVLFLVLSRYRDKETAWFAALITFTCGGFFFTCGVVLLDMLLAFFTVSAWLCYYAFIRESDKKIRSVLSVLVFVLLAFGFMTKGPVALVMFGLPVFFWTLLNKRWDTLRDHSFVIGGLLFLLIVVPWFVMAERSTPGFLKYFFINENLLRFIKHDYGDLYGNGHTFPRGMAILFMFLLGLPWSFVLFASGIKNFKESGENIRNFIFSKKRFLKLLSIESNNVAEKYGYFFLGFVTITFFWCFARQLLAYYLLPAVPAFGIWCAILFKKYQVNLNRILPASVVLVVIYVSAIALFADIKGRDRSTKYLLADIIASASSYSAGELPAIIFVRHIPNSAYFYGADTVVVHPDESATTTLMRDYSYLGNSNIVYIIKRKYLKKVPVKLMSGFDIQKYSGNWMILRRLNARHIAG